MAQGLPEDRAMDSAVNIRIPISPATQMAASRSDRNPRRVTWGLRLILTLIGGISVCTAPAQVGASDKRIGVSLGYHETYGALDGTKAILNEGQQELGILPHLEGLTLGLSYNYRIGEKNPMRLDLSYDVAVETMKLPRFKGKVVNNLINMDLESGFPGRRPIYPYISGGFGYSLLFVQDGTIKYDDKGLAEHSNTWFNGFTIGGGLGVYLSPSRKMLFKLEAGYRWTLYEVKDCTGGEAVLALTYLH
jgi:hypothetical protein